MKQLKKLNFSGFERLDKTEMKKIGGGQWGFFCTCYTLSFSPMDYFHIISLDDFNAGVPICRGTALGFACSKI